MGGRLPHRGGGLGGGEVSQVTTVRPVCDEVVKSVVQVQLQVRTEDGVLVHDLPLWKLVLVTTGGSIVLAHVSES